MQIWKKLSRYFTQGGALGEPLTNRKELGVTVESFMETVVESPKSVKKQTGITVKKQMKNENPLDKAAVCQHLNYYKESCSLHLKQTSVQMIKWTRILQLSTGGICDRHSLKIWRINGSKHQEELLNTEVGTRAWLWPQPAAVRGLQRSIHWDLSVLGTFWGCKGTAHTEFGTHQAAPQAAHSPPH